MKKIQLYKNIYIRENIFPLSLFFIYFCILLLMSGIHIGLLILMNRMAWNDVIQTVVPILYWGSVSMGLTLFTKKKVKDTYEEPLHKLAKATDQVAKGDFSVYVPTIHTSDKYDYLDLMIVDFNKMVEELGSVETLKTEFFSNVSHEIKTPLAIIQNYAELLKDKNLSETQRQEYVQNIYDSVKRLSNLITNILKLNKLEKQTIAPNCVSYDLSAQLCQCILNFENLWDQKNIEIEADIEDQRIIDLDQELLELVWNNLISNAIKFTNQNGMISIKQYVENHYCIVSISDSGCGMDEMTQKHIFEKFYQGDTSHATQGNGLGLALVMRVIHLLNGTIEVESQLGTGSTFTVKLPMDERGVNGDE